MTTISVPPRVLPAQGNGGMDFHPREPSSQGTTQRTKHDQRDRHVRRVHEVRDAHHDAFRPCASWPFPITQDRREHMQICRVIRSVKNAEHVLTPGDCLDGRPQQCSMPMNLTRFRKWLSLHLLEWKCLWMSFYKRLSFVYGLVGRRISSF